MLSSSLQAEERDRERKTAIFNAGGKNVRFLTSPDDTEELTGDFHFRISFIYTYCLYLYIYICTHTYRYFYIYTYIHLILYISVFVLVC